LVTLQGKEEVFTDATLLGAAGGPSAWGGSLVISSSRFSLPTAVLTPLDVTLAVTQGGETIPASFYPQGQTAIGNTVLDANGNVLPQLGYFAADRFTAGG